MLWGFCFPSSAMLADGTICSDFEPMLSSPKKGSAVEAQAMDSDRLLPREVAQVDELASGGESVDGAGFGAGEIRLLPISLPAASSELLGLGRAGRERPGPARVEWRGRPAEARWPRPAPAAAAAVVVTPP